MIKINQEKKAYPPKTPYVQNNFIDRKGRLLYTIIRKRSLQVFHP